MLSSNQPGPGYDELVEPGGAPRPTAQGLWRHLTALGLEALLERQQAADREIRSIGVTFQTYDGDAVLDRPWPFDVIPRVLAASEWARVREGLIQRLRALNLFIDDVYHDQRSVSSDLVNRTACSLSSV